MMLAQRDPPELSRAAHARPDARSLALLQELGPVRSSSLDLQELSSSPLYVQDHRRRDQLGDERQERQGRQRCARPPPCADDPTLSGSLTLAPARSQLQDPHLVHRAPGLCRPGRVPRLGPGKGQALGRLEHHAAEPDVDQGAVSPPVAHRLEQEGRTLAAHLLRASLSPLVTRKSADSPLLRTGLLVVCRRPASPSGYSMLRILC